jgi:ubiquinone/menaquinone biosynthesis C-methylase UbiE
MSVSDSILMRAFGRPEGVLGRIGGVILSRMNRNIAKQTIDKLEILPSDKVLEVGFGPGVGIQLLVRSASSGLVAGVDPSSTMLEQARARNAADLESGKADLRQGSVEKLPYADHTFDRAMAINSMQAWPDVDAALRELRRVVKPSGRVALGFTRHSGQGRRDAAEALALAAAGFLDVQLIDVEGGFCALAANGRRHH